MSTSDAATELVERNTEMQTRHTHTLTHTHVHTHTHTHTHTQKERAGEHAECSARQRRRRRGGGNCGVGTLFSVWFCFVRQKNGAHRRRRSRRDAGVATPRGPFSCCLFFFRCRRRLLKTEKCRTRKRETRDAAVGVRRAAV